MYKRFFAFGCSYTKWIWPTWADIVSWDLEIPSQNWAIPGHGNVGIFHRMVECDLKNKLTDQDLIVNMWSHWNREDRYLNGGWVAHGNIFNTQLYDRRFLVKYWSLENDIIKNSTAIVSANKMFNIAFQGHIIAPAEFETNKKIFSKKETELLDFYKPHFSSDNIFGIFPSTTYTHLIADNHPDILQHLNFVKTSIYPSLGLVLKDKTIDICNSINYDIIHMLKNKIDIVTELKSLIHQKYNLTFNTPNYGF